MLILSAVASSTSSSIPPEVWGAFGGLISLLVAIVAILGRQLEKTTTALESLQNKMIDQAVPALERSTIAGQAMGPILQQNAEAMGAMTKATEDSIRECAELRQWVAILKDRDNRPPPRRGSPT